MAKKTISGARAKRGQRSNGCNPRHNNRDYLPSNADPNRQHLNEFFAESTKALTIDQIYDKLFQESYEAWLAKERAKGRQVGAPDKYIDKIRNSPDKKNKKREQYEIIWQIGDMKNTGWRSNQFDFMAARELLLDFAEHLQTLPEIEFATPEKINDPNWQPKSDCCLVVTNLALHGDENTPQLHMDFIPYCRGAKRGQKIQNAYAAAFEGMGYAVKTYELTDEFGQPIYKQDRNGNVIYQKNPDGSVRCNDMGEPMPEPVVRKESFGSIEWIEEQKQWIATRMMERHGWEREYKGKNKFGDVTLSEYIAEDNKRIIEEQEQHIKKTKEHLSLAVRRYHEIASINEKNQRILNRQKQKMADLEERVGALQTIEEYTQEADQLEAQVSSVTNKLLNRLSEAIRPFKRKEAELFIDGIKNALEDVFKQMRGSLKRLTTFESDIEMSEEERRSPALTEQIQAAERQAGVERSVQPAVTSEQLKEYYQGKDRFWSEYNQAKELAAEELRQVYHSEAMKDAYRRYKQAQHLVKNSAGIITLGLSVAVLIMTKADLKREQQRAEHAKELQQELQSLCRETVNLNVVQREASRRKELTSELESEILEQQRIINDRLEEIRKGQKQTFFSGQSSDHR